MFFMEQTISFRLIRKTFHIWDLPIEAAIQEDHRPPFFSVLLAPHAKFIHCTYKKIKSQGALSLEDCVLEEIQAKGNVLLKNCQIQKIRTEGELALLDCTEVEEIRAKKIYLDTSLPEARIFGLLVRLCRPLEARHLTQQESEITGDITLTKETETLALEGTVCKGNVVFPKRSLFPLAKRKVFLKNGAKILGKVIRGKLIE